MNCLQNRGKIPRVLADGVGPSQVIACYPDRGLNVARERETCLPVTGSHAI